MKIKMLILALSGGLLVSALAQGATEVDGIAAIVNNKVITKGEVRSAAQTQVRILVMNDNNQVRSQAALEARVNEIEENALRDLVDRELILDEFESLGATIRQQHIEDAVSRFIQERFSGDRKQFAKELDRSGLSLKQFRDMQRETIIVQAMRSRNAGADDSIVTPFEREKFWEENQELFASDGFVKLRTITIPKITDNNAATAESQKKLVNEILTKLRGGADFGTMARTYSVDSGAKENGVRGTFSRSDLNSQLGDAAFSIPPQTVSELIDLGDFYTLVYVDARELGKVSPLEEVEDEVHRRVLQNKRQEKVNKWLDRLRSSANIRIVE